MKRETKINTQLLEQTGKWIDGGNALFYARFDIGTPVLVKFNEDSKPLSGEVVGVYFIAFKVLYDVAVKMVDSSVPGNQEVYTTIISKLDSIFVEPFVETVVQ